MFSQTDNLSFIHDTRFYTVPEVASILNRSDDLVRKLFRHEADCVKLSEPKPGKRAYMTLLIPGWVLKRALRRMMG